ncbi:ROK family protein [Tropicimonas sp.]|uniref:ROK family transcriptional regulator n=1 Tax=Tropicimonas sp. TaxID=2067044 RepID=UPI003A895265
MLADIAIGANAERARNHNRQVVLRRVRAAESIGRAEIARASGLSTQAVSNIIANLLDDALIVECGRRAAGRGLPAVQYALNPAGGYAIGVEIRPAAVFATMLNMCGECVAAERRALGATDRETVTHTVRDLTRQVAAAGNVGSGRIMGAGIVMPGPFGETGIRDAGSELPHWGDSPVDAWFSAALGLPVLVENDANAAAMAERVRGVAQGLGNFALLYFGTGLGLGVVCDGALVTGAYGNAGEIGHLMVPAGGRYVALESLVSRNAVQRSLAETGIVAATVDDLERLCSASEPALTNWLDRAAEPLSAAVGIVENLFDPETVILGGAMPDCLLDRLIGAVRLPGHSVSNRGDRRHPRLMRGASGRMTATLGAAALVLEQAFVPKITVAT